MLYQMLIGMFQQMKEQFTTVDDPSEALRLLLRMSLLSHLEDERMYKLMSFVMMQKTVVDKYTDLFRGFYNSFIEILTDILTKLEIESPEFEARTISAIIDGLQFHMVYVGGELKIEAMIEFIENKYCKRSKK